MKPPEQDRRERRTSRGVPDPLTSWQPFTLVWRGEPILVTRANDYWSLRRGANRDVPGPRVLPLERWSETVDRVKEWLEAARME
jgi:hypothetical protein